VKDRGVRASKIVTRGSIAVKRAARVPVYARWQMKNAKNPRKAIVIISDGCDNNSKYSARQIESLVREADSPTSPATPESCNTSGKRPQGRQWVRNLFYFGSALNTGLGVDATPNLLTFGRRTTAALKAALEIDVGALS
jgi:hypothetical protein